MACARIIADASPAPRPATSARESIARRRLISVAGAGHSFPSATLDCGAADSGCRFVSRRIRPQATADAKAPWLCKWPWRTSELLYETKLFIVSVTSLNYTAGVWRNSQLPSRLASSFGYSPGSPRRDLSAKGKERFADDDNASNCAGRSARKHRQTARATRKKLIQRWSEKDECIPENHEGLSARKPV